MLNFQHVISQYSLDINTGIRCLAQSLLGSGEQKPCYLFGRNDLSAQLSDVIHTDGFIDDYAPAESTWHGGKPVLALDQVSSDAVIVNCVICARPNSAMSRIRAAGFSQVLSYSDLCRALPDIVALPDFVVQTRLDLTHNADKWQTVYEGLADVASRAVFDDVLRFRLTADLIRPWLATRFGRPRPVF